VGSCMIVTDFECFVRAIGRDHGRQVSGAAERRYPDG
jgi:hypothetical protein